jgi:hypothetical protein
MPTYKPHICPVAARTIKHKNTDSKASKTERGMNQNLNLLRWTVRVPTIPLSQILELTIKPLPNWEISFFGSQTRKPTINRNPKINNHSAKNIFGFSLTRFQNKYITIRVAVGKIRIDTSKMATSPRHITPH